MTSLRARIIAELEPLGVEYRSENRPDCRFGPGRDDGLAGLYFNGKAFAHFHHDHELDIRLTRAVIEREGLSHPKGSAVHPNRSARSPWIEVRFATAEDVDEVLRLVRIAIAQIL